MSATISKTPDWSSVPGSSEVEWRAVFQASREPVHLSAPCPVCETTALRRWFQASAPIHYRPGFRARGGLWEWCSSCRVFSHYSALVPDWWSSDLVVDSGGLTPYPTAIEEAINATNRGAA